jgi:hypothetical protein
MSEKISWQELAENLETITEVGDLGGTDLATQVLEYAIGADFFEDAVEHYICFRPGYELARSVLARLRTQSATLHCYKIYKTTESIIKRRAAVELLAVAGTAKTLEWIPEFLSDPDPEGDIPRLTMRILEQMLYRKVISDDKAKPMYTLALQHPDNYIREIALSYLVEEEDD